jgi:hypothetical protein
MSIQKNINDIKKEKKLVQKKINLYINDFYKLIEPINSEFNDIDIVVGGSFKESIDIDFNVRENEHENDNDGTLSIDLKNNNNYSFKLNIENSYKSHSDIFNDKQSRETEYNLKSGMALFNIGNDIKQNPDKYENLISQIIEQQLNLLDMDHNISNLYENIEKNKTSLFLNDIYTQFNCVDDNTIEDIMNDDQAELYFIYPTIVSTEDNFYVRFEKSFMKCKVGCGRRYSRDGNQISKADIKEQLKKAIVIKDKLAVEFDFLENSLGIPYSKDKKTVNILYDDFYTLLQNKQSVKDFMKQKNDKHEQSEKKIQGKLSKFTLYGF